MGEQACEFKVEEGGRGKKGCGEGTCRESGRAGCLVFYETGNIGRKYIGLTQGHWRKLWEKKHILICTRLYV